MAAAPGWALVPIVHGNLIIVPTASIRRWEEELLSLFAENS